MSDTIHVKGLSELGNFLRGLDDKMRTSIMRAALRKGANMVKEQAKLNVPIAPPTERNQKRYNAYQGALRDSIRVGTRSKGGVITGYIRAGGKKRADVYYAAWVERGTQPHKIGKPGQRLKINGKTVIGPVDHPGARPHPYLRPALDAQAEAAVRTMGQTIASRLRDKTALDSSYSFEIDGEAGEK